MNRDLPDEEVRSIYSESATSSFVNYTNIISIYIIYQAVALRSGTWKNNNDLLYDFRLFVAAGGSDSHRVISINSQILQCHEHLRVFSELN